MKTEHIVIAILIIVILCFIWNNNKEHLTGNEAVLNIARVYTDASGSVNFNNIRTTGNLGVTGNLDVSGVARFNNIKTTGNLDISGGNLDVSGSARFAGPTNIVGPLVVNGDYAINGGSTLNGPLVVNAPVSLGRGFYAHSPDGSKSLHLGNDAKLYIMNGTEKVWSSQ